MRADGLPSVALYPQALVKHDSLYNTFGKLITNSTYCAGENIDGNFSYHIYAPNTIEPIVVNQEGPSNSFWIGYFHTHFGHFLTSTLQRLWSLKASQNKFNYYTCANFNNINDTDHIYEFIFIILDSLGIRYQNLVNVRDFSILRNITVAEPIFVENSHAYSDWAIFMRSIRQCLIGKHSPHPQNRPIFISRSHIKTGTRQYQGEDLLCECLEKFGIDICYPEELPFLDQLRLWNNYNIFLGFSGSSFLNSIFFQGKKIIIINHDNYIFGTQRMIDLESENKAIYLDAHAYLKKGTSDPNLYEIVNPHKLAIDLIRIIQKM